jgi:hypothetical protein
MAYGAVRMGVADQYLRKLDALADAAGLGSVSTVLLEFETAPVAVVHAPDGGGVLIKGPSPAATARVLLEARRFSAQPRPAAPPAAQYTYGGDAYWDEWIEVVQAVLEPAGQVVTARVELVHGGRRVIATSVGRNAAERHLYLMAEAAARAVTEFLPPGYGVILGEIKPLPGELHTLRASVLFMTPEEDRPLEGIAAVEGRPDIAAARTVLAAVGNYVKPLLSHAGNSP